MQYLTDSDEESDIPGVINTEPYETYLQLMSRRARLRDRAIRLGKNPDWAMCGWSEEKEEAWKQRALEQGALTCAYDHWWAPWSGEECPICRRILEIMGRFFAMM